MENRDVNIELDAIFDALGHERRRSLLLGLRDHNPQGEVPEELLADGTEATEGRGETPGDGGRGATQSISLRAAMVHVHLPKLERYGFVDWDEEAHEVSRGPNFDALRPFLDAIATYDAEDTPDGRDR